MDGQESAEAKVAAAHGGEGPNIKSRTGTEHSMRQGDAESRVRSPSGAGRQAAEPPMAQRRAPNRTACEDNARDGTMELIQAVMRRENMIAAHQRVVQNGGAPGVDGMTVEELMPFCQKHWTRIREDFSAIVRRHGYTLIANQPKYPDPLVQKYGISPGAHLLFRFEI